MMVELVAKSGALQIAIGAWLGWANFAFLRGASRIGPLRDRRRTMQAHLDFLMMGTMSLALSAIGDFMGVDDWYLVLIIIGSWMNPSAFLFLAVVDDFEENHPQLSGMLPLAGFVALTVGWTWAAIDFVGR